MLFMLMRIEVTPKADHGDGRARRILRELSSHVCRRIAGLVITDVYLISGLQAEDSDLAAVFLDPVSEEMRIVRDARGDAVPEEPAWDYLIEVSYRPGVTDPEAITARRALSAYLDRGLTAEVVIQTARTYSLLLSDSSGGLTEEETAAVSAHLHNPLVQQAVILSTEDLTRGDRLPDSYPVVTDEGVPAVRWIALAHLGDEDLLKMSADRLLALTAGEMRAVQSYFSDPAVIRDRRACGMPEEASDVEIEMIAQTWSEHCKHKIFQARITYREADAPPREIDGLFSTYIKETTERVGRSRPDLRSVFHDNSGVVSFDDQTVVCFKAETHNSPSALDPYGGAITGIVGVNRDIMGTGKGAKPIFNTNVLCFGLPDTDPAELPAGLMHPRRILSGVHRGIVDGGNQSGIPTVAGAFLFDESFTGKPLVFCGTGGVMPASINGEPSWEKHIDAGDLAVMVGGRIGKDGIHGATFSSLALDETSPTSAVQIGDPITQKLMLDFLLEARDRGLYKGITDNGAGGLSSSFGEMAESSGGVRLQLERAPLKYHGLAPWEILVSESQERMSLAVDPARIEEFLELASRRDVEATVIGEFTSGGLVEAFYEDRQVVRLSLEFLHHGLPQMKLNATWEPPRAISEVPLAEESNEAATLARDLLTLLGSPNIASREALVRQYDHEVQARSVVKPFVGVNADAPSDGAVLRPRYDSDRGLSVTHGICPRYGDVDTYHMAACAVDEAMRAHVALGGDPDQASALDNFCWPDPVFSQQTPDGEYKLAQLVRACEGLSETCLSYTLPLISGKDSMKNDAHLGGRKVSVRPTLLVSLMGIVVDVKKALTTDFKQAGDLIYLTGETRGELGGTSYEMLRGKPLGTCPSVDAEGAMRRYRALHGVIAAGLVNAAHDLSDGGLAVALCESALGGSCGAEIALEALPGYRPESETARLLFCESAGRILVTVAPEHREAFEAGMEGHAVRRVGRVVTEKRVTFSREGVTATAVELPAVETAWEQLAESLQ